MIISIITQYKRSHVSKVKLLPGFSTSITHESGTPLVNALVNGYHIPNGLTTCATVVSKPIYPSAWREHERIRIK